MTLTLTPILFLALVLTCIGFRLYVALMWHCRDRCSPRYDGLQVKAAVLLQYMRMSSQKQCTMLNSLLDWRPSMYSMTARTEHPRPLTVICYKLHDLRLKGRKPARIPTNVPHDPGAPHFGFLYAVRRRYQRI